MNIEVKGCSKCPFVNYNNNETVYCGLSRFLDLDEEDISKDNNGYYPMDEKPDWCKLTEGELTIKLDNV